MVKTLTTALALVTLVACNNEKTSTASNSTEDSTNMKAATAQDGFVPLFDGKTLTGWHKYGGGAVGKAWQVSDGTIMLDAAHKADWQAADGGDIVTDEEYGNFHLKYD